MHPARLGPLFCLNDDPQEIFAHWDDYDGRDNQMFVVPYGNVEFHEDIWRGKRTKRQKYSYKNEQ